MARSKVRRRIVGECFVSFNLHNVSQRLIISGPSPPLRYTNRINWAIKQIGRACTSYIMCCLKRQCVPQASIRVDVHALHRRILVQRALVMKKVKFIKASEVDNGRGCGFEDPLWDRAVGAAAQVDLIESARGDCSDKRCPSARVAGLTLLRKRYEATSVQKVWREAPGIE
jgi:hypothetical protein